MTYHKFGSYFFREGTDEKVKSIINAQSRARRLRFIYGDKETGDIWLEEYDTIGYIGRSTGAVQIPLLVNNSRSYGGGELSTRSILRILDVKTKQELYRHENYKAPVLTIETPANAPAEYPFSVIRDGKECQANFKTRLHAQHYIDFMLGKRMRVL